MQEIWRDIKGYENLYEISNLGKIRSLTKNKEINFKNRKNNSGYYRVSLTKNKHSREFLVHRLVAITFLDNPLNKKQVNHKNGNKEDNRVENLEWCTASENQKHAYFQGLREIKMKRAIPVIQLDKQGREIRKWISISQAHKVLKISSAGIQKCCEGKYKTSNGYIWKYAN